MESILTSKKLQGAVLLILGLTALGAVLYFLRSVLAPFAMAVFINILLSPLIDRMQSNGLPRSLAVGVTFVLSAILLVLSMAIVALSFDQLVDQAGEYEKRFVELYWEIIYAIPDKFGEKIDIEQFLQLALSSVKAVFSFFSSSIFALLGQSVVIGLFVVFFLLAEKKPKQDDPLVQKIEAQIRQYMMAKIGLSLLTAALTGALLSWGQVDLALVFALLTFILNFIPNIGSILAVVLPLPVLLLSPSLTLKGSLLILGAMMLVQFVIGNLIEPKLIGDKLELDPSLVLISLLLWGAMWGILGAILAVPITAALKLVLQSRFQAQEDDDQIPRETKLLSSEPEERKEDPLGPS